MGRSKRMNSSPDGGFYYRNNILKHFKGQEMSNNIDVDLELIFKEMQEKRDFALYERKNDLEYDLRSTKWICEKAKNSEVYCQNLYAALCNNVFIKNDVWTILQNEEWSCSWRSAGGIVADMVEKGDYMDWYCSGIRNFLSEDDYKNLPEESKNRYDNIEKYFVEESIVTEEIKTDLFSLGWLVKENDIPSTI